MRTLKRVAAVISSAAVLTALGMTSFIANAQTTVPLSDRTSELDGEVVSIVADEVYASAGERVAFSINLADNEGYATGGIVLTYDSRLKIQMSTSETVPKGIPGEAAEGLAQFYAVNEKLSMASIGTEGQNDCTVPEGVYATLYFDVPADAKEGDTFPMTLKVDKWLDWKSNPVSYYPVNGWIKIVNETTTSSTTTTESTTTTTESTTTSSTTTTESTTTETTTTTESTSSTTTESTTTTSSTTTESTTTLSTTTESSTTQSTTTQSTTTESTTSSTTESTTTSTTVTQQPPTPITETSTTASTSDTEKNTTKAKTEPTKVNPGVIPTTTPAPGAKTGDAGVGIAAAVLTTALAAALGLSAKRKDQ